MSFKETIENTATGWISDLESRSLDIVVSKWTDDIHYAVHPDDAGVYPMTREQFRTNDRTATIFQNLKLFKIRVNEIYSDAEKRTVTMVCTSNGELEVGPYRTDCLFVLTMTEDGKKIVKLTEWLDTHSRQ
ncbi:hypothetical protein EDB81DRAFT_766683 [Dactylonectria macrodidyma]|uniref:SnoaL-like domain-containing protein n=1 Tax=Dactylonectria macrodidyma TaxID=307937 RepID=A0A9P9DHC9_9HYPO|nr:hypothetical protein EDB81DRAFT_766683 [Dactylonectria macrodidyma]